VPSVDGEALHRLLQEHRINSTIVRRELAVLDFGRKQVDWALRLSPHYYDTTEELDAVLEVLVRAGQFFGEMGLLAGDSRNATVIARTDVECYRLDRSAFQALLLARPELADEVSKVVASRKPGLDIARAEAAQATTVPVESAEPALLARIQRFFGLKQ
jgi:CRP-like cAMP-binding protein